jgi:hypothetical protein
LDIDNDFCLAQTFSQSSVFTLQAIVFYGERIAWNGFLAALAGLQASDFARRPQFAPGGQL